MQSWVPIIAMHIYFILLKVSSINRVLRNLSSTHKDPSDVVLSPSQLSQDQDQIAQDKLRLLGSHQNWSRGNWYSCGGYSIPSGGVRSPAEDSNGCLTSGSPIDDYTVKKGKGNQSWSCHRNQLNTIQSNPTQRLSIIILQQWTTQSFHSLPHLPIQYTV